MLRSSGRCFRPPGLRKLQEIWTAPRCSSASTLRPPPSSSFAVASAGTRSPIMSARCSPDSLRLCGPKMQTSPNKRLGEGGIGSRDPGLHSLAAFLASSSSTTSLCRSLWPGCNDTHDPDVAAAEAHFRRAIRERPGDPMAPHALIATCPTCVMPTHWTLCWNKPSKGTRSPSNYTRSPVLKPGWEDPTHLSLAGMPPLFAPPCSTTFASPSWTRTHSAPFYGQFLDRFCDHAAVCPCAGGCNLRHNAIALCLPQSKPAAGLPATTHLPRLDSPWERRGARSLGFCGHNLPRRTQAQRQHPLRTSLSTKISYGRSTTDHSMPPEPPPLHPGALRWTRRRLWRLSTEPGHPDLPPAQHHLAQH